MKAIVYTEYGGPEVLHVANVPKPEMKPDDVLIKVHAVSVNFGDLLARKFKNVSPGEFNMLFLFWLIARFTFGWNKPKNHVLGNSFSGVIEARGQRVTRFSIGDPVFGYTAEKMGAMAENLVMPASGILAVKPANMTFEEASAVPYGAVTALSLLKNVSIQKGQKVLVVGASGAIGSAAVQLAGQYYGAEVTGLCSAGSFDFVRRIGADRVIDYQKEDFTQNGETYDLIFDVLGRGRFSKYKSSLTPKGIYFSVSFKSLKLLQMLWTSLRGGKKVRCALSNCSQQDLLFIKERIEAGSYTSIIDTSFPFEQAAEAHQYVERGSRNGSVVITIESYP